MNEPINYNVGDISFYGCIWLNKSWPTVKIRAGNYAGYNFELEPMWCGDVTDGIEMNGFFMIWSDMGTLGENKNSVCDTIPHQNMEELKTCYIDKLKQGWGCGGVVSNYVYVNGHTHDGYYVPVTAMDLDASEFKETMKSFAELVEVKDAQRIGYERRIKEWNERNRKAREEYEAEKKRKEENAQRWAREHRIRYWLGLIPEEMIE